MITSIKYKYFLLFFVCISVSIINARVIDDSYQRAYSRLDIMLNYPYLSDFNKAVFIVENAYFEDKLNYEIYSGFLKTYANFTNWLSTTNLVNYQGHNRLSVSKHAALFKIMSDTVSIMLSDSLIKHLPYQYNFDDYAGKKNWSNMFVTTLVTTRKGNCHSLPLLYKLIAEEMGEKAWLALAPNHLYIKLHNEANGWYNTELTSGQFPTDTWIKSSGYIHLDAIKNGIYMDTLSQQQSIALCMVDLAQGYQHKYPKDYDPEFVLKCCNTALEYFPNYINGLLLKAETKLTIYQRKKDKDSKELEEIEKLYAHIHNLGYRKMPEKMYLDWLMSFKDKSN